MADKNAAFVSKPGDPKDVSWALTTADTCWRKGDRAGALKWLRKAVETASEAELDERALELAKAAADLATHIESMVPPAPPSAPLVSVPPAPKSGALPPLPSKAGPLPPKVVPKPGPRAPLSAAAPSKRKSVTNEASRSGAPRKRSHSRTDRHEGSDRGSRADEIDAWPTEVVPGDELPSAIASKDPQASQAVRVHVWRDADGTVKVRHFGANAPKKAIEAMLVASDPAVSLLELLAEKS